MTNTVAIRKSVKYSTRTTAIHEAGHVLADWWSGKEIYQAHVRMKPNSTELPIISRKGDEIKDAVGLVETSPLISLFTAREFPDFIRSSVPNYLTHLDHDLMGLMAGPVAEALHTRQSQFYVMMNGGAGDVKAAQILLDLLPADTHYATEQRAIKRAGKMLREHWDTVKALADLLQAHGTVDGDTLMGVIEARIGEQRCNTFQD